ncbi:energy-coupling factor ABC transporter ATP-binding protein [Gordonibacter sp. An230]|uniref:energy-coupling factor ABC transporter ATP-binding protein n=1 Tax=Gordonibacter sp. An230 TaxID=1965592 RepID=UPI000B38E9F7|nr:ABC transporter ATP-binding protein [Gordonibacter sp. An230]OUO91769.1 energy-coupling factor ABC transporter ATP-binding protein [Gordonibacter sp. An230]
MIEFKDVRASYERSLPILKGVSFAIRDGEFVAFAGTNGAGKSTAMRLVNGLLKPDAGEVLIDGVPTTALRTSELARRVGFLFQNPDRQICCSTVREELLFGFRALGAADADAEARVDAVIEEFGFAPDDDPFLLNRGARQLLALASVAVLEPSVLVLDEPTTGLDFRECEKVMGIVRGIHARGATVVMVCHDMEVVADYAKRCIVMSDGRVVADGPVFEVLRDHAVLGRASLVPPQIVDISLVLAAESPRLAGTPVARANTVEEMVEAVAAEAGRAGAGAGEVAGEAGVAAAGGAAGEGARRGHCASVRASKSRRVP